LAKVIPLLRHFLLLSVLLCLVHLPAFGDAVLPPASPITQPLDLLPLKKALTPLDTTQALQSHTTLYMTGTHESVSVTLREDLQIVARYPNRFRASLTQYDTHGGPKKKLVIISNGALVWTYRPGLRRYSVMPYADWKKTDNAIPTLGMIIGGFYLGEGRPLVQGFHSITSANSADVLSVLSGMDVSLSRQIKSVGNQDDYVYSLMLSKQDLAYQFYVGSQTGRLTRLDLAGTQDNTDVTYREDIKQISSRPVISTATFAFAPPPGVTQTAVVSIDPF